MAYTSNNSGTAYEPAKGSILNNVNYSSRLVSLPTDDVIVYRLFDKDGMEVEFSTDIINEDDARSASIQGRTIHPNARYEIIKVAEGKGNLVIKVAPNNLVLCHLDDTKFEAELINRDGFYFRYKIYEIDNFGGRSSRICDYSREGEHDDNKLISRYTAGNNARYTLENKYENGGVTSELLVELNFPGVIPWGVVPEFTTR